VTIDRRWPADRRPGAPVGPVAPARPFALRVVAAAGLAVDAYVHADLASSYPAGFLGEQNLFLVETGVALGAALLVLTSSRRRVYLAAALIAASALAAVVAYRYVDLGALGPLPDLYEPVWYPEKVVAATGEAVALAASALLLAGTPSPPGRPGR
jgi:hypothetical protein